jgi:hypothetical protein
MSIPRKRNGPLLLPLDFLLPSFDNLDILIKVQTCELGWMTLGKSISVHISLEKSDRMWSVFIFLLIGLHKHYIIELAFILRLTVYWRNRAQFGKGGEIGESSSWELEGTVRGGLLVGV